MELKEAQKKNTEMDDLEEKIDAVTEVLKHGEELANESKARVERFEEQLKSKKFHN